MAGQVVQMDYGVVAEVAKAFNAASQAVTLVGQVLEQVFTILGTLALASGATAQAFMALAEYHKGKSEAIARLCQEFSQDLTRAIQDHQSGDVQGKRYFGEGVGR